MIVRKFSRGFKRGNITIKVIIIGSIINKNDNLIFKYFETKLWSSLISIFLFILRGLKIPNLIKCFLIESSDEAIQKVIDITKKPKI